MASPKNTHVAPAPVAPVAQSIVPPAPVVQALVPAPNAATIPSIDFEARMASVNAQFKALQQTKDADFEAEAKDFWKPTQDGDTLKGVYLGREKEARYFVHSFATAHPKTGVPFLTRVNGSRILSKELAKGQIGQGVKLVYHGQTVTGAGQKLNMFDVLWARKA